MRPKVAAGIVLLAIGILGAAVFLPRAFHHEQEGEAAGNLSVAQTETNISPEIRDAVPILPSVANNKATAAVPPVIQETSHADQAGERISELMALAMNDDSNSLNIIWSELSNPDKQIREGALEAVVQFGDRSVVPRLRELAAQVEDPAEKAGILAAADHLDLPPFGEPHKQGQ